MKLRQLESDNEIRKLKDQRAELINIIKRLGRIEEMATELKRPSQ